MNVWYTFIVCSVKTSESFRILYSLNNGSVCALYLLFASAPLNATKIAGKKVSDVDVCMVGPEL